MPRWFRWLGCGCAPKVTESPLPPEPESSSTLAPNPDHVLAAAFMLVAEAYAASALACGRMAQAREALQAGMPGYGYIFSTSNCIYTGMPLANYERMLDVWRREGNY